MIAYVRIEMFQLNTSSFEAVILIILIVVSLVLNILGHYPPLPVLFHLSYLPSSSCCATEDQGPPLLKPVDDGIIRLGLSLAPMIE